VAVAVRITPSKMTRADYEKVRSDLAAQGRDDPPGRLFHAAYGDDEVHMFEVWDSKEAFEEQQTKLFSVLQASGVNVGGVEIHSLHWRAPTEALRGR
jgi:quinol monooxygenase YgiN